MSDYQPVLDELFAQAKAAFDPLAAKYKAQLKELEEDTRAVFADVFDGTITVDDGEEALKTSARTLRSILVAGGLDAASQAPGFAMNILEKVLPILLKLVLA